MRSIPGPNAHAWPLSRHVSARWHYGVKLAANSKTLIPCPRDKRRIARITRLHRGGLNVQQIATKVTAEGYYSRSGALVSKSPMAVGRRCLINIQLDTEGYDLLT